MEPPYIPLAYQIYYVVVAFIGIVGNSCIVYVTIQSRNLRSACNIFVALVSLGDVAYMLAQIVMVVSYNLSPNHMILHKTCVYWQVVPVFGMCFSTVLLCSVALDRLISLQKFYSSFAMSCKGWYVFSQVWLAATFSVIVAALSLFSSIPGEVICIVTAALQGQVSDIVFDGALVANVFILVCYGLFLRGVRRITIKKKNMTVYRPLIMISISVILGWITIISFGVISILIRLNINNLDVVLIAGLPINLSMAGNFFVYYAVSKQYRKLFDYHLRIRAVKNFLGLREAQPQRGTLFVTNFQR